MVKVKYKIPKLRFPEFIKELGPKRISEITERASFPVQVDKEKTYQEIGIKSHGRGVFHKDPVLGKKIGNKRVFWIKEDAFIVNIVFAWEQAVAKTTTNETGMIASHRFPMYLPKKGILNTDFLLYYFLTKKGKYKLEMASPGGAGRNKTLGQKEFEKVKISLPSLPEQQKIASFLTSVDDKIQQLTKKKELLEQYKKGVMQKIFKQEIRFRDEDGREFPEWEICSFGEVFTRVTDKNKENNQNVLTISAQSGLINQEEFFNKSVAAKDVTGYYLLNNGDFAYNKSYSKGYPMGAIKRLNKYDKGVVSTLYICFRIRENFLPEFFEQYFESGQINKELHKIAQEGARNHGLLNLSVVEFFRDIEVHCPCFKEQKNISNFLLALDNKINATSSQLEKTKEFKKGLLQQMFV